MDKKYSKIFEPINIGGVEVRNRINMAPMTTLYAGHNGEVTEQIVQYYGARARGGTGMVTVEGAYVNEMGIQIPGSINVSDDKYIPGLSRVADAIKGNGGVAVLQLIHSGIQAWVEQAVGPSEIGRIDGKPISTEKTPRALTTKEVNQYVQDFADAALRAKIAGFDIVQVHGTHGYLIMQFLSPLTNKRTDNYGADRDLFPVEIVKAIKEKCGQDFPVMYRLCADESLGDELINGGITLEDAKKTAEKLENVGVDAFDVTGGSDDVIHLYVPSSYVLEENEGCFIDLAAEIKKTVNVPVMSGGGVESPDAAEQLLESGQVDMIFMGRQLIADPEWVSKIEKENIEGIKQCVKCVECGKRIAFLRDMRCAVNPIVGNEWKYLTEKDLPKAANKKKILVIGAGPGGLEAARTSAMRGHDVTIVDKESKVGGTLNVAAVPNFKSKFKKLINWYKQQLEELKINLILNKSADLEFIQEVNPDEVILATGSEEVVPSIPGVENTVISDEVLLGNKEVGENVVVIGCGLVGAETAYYIAKSGKKVNVFETLPQTDLGIGGIALLRPSGLFEKYGVTVNFNTPIVEIYEDGVLTVDKFGKKIITKADTIVCAVGRQPVHGSDFVKSIRENGMVVKPVGDVKSARTVYEALHEAFNAAVSI
ncbi:NAD(P)/FAD-dependent oxidoreductase [Natranaerobius thermophilus]|uniref:NADH:flavin oxidoreductase/NADH oxidase n=1 Tax=Natranaerobius thermophilus (strain ATCC BAA-1301 / DSM 18059 / JW/NM-WN-LF) TaxID=457570 RepID=B2A1T3_NATTJ|nr:NAD(P)/FAD-dependent oxidoreductase [Natranaerobius thermophilus]ACB86130.1 NADH:flavin oxidoreductase/NADH oxidase [Natranaerobius thermophilus JW/NM-WN-LF]